MDVLIKTMPKMILFISSSIKKRAQGKAYYVYMTAGANKFLRILLWSGERISFITSRIRIVS